MKYPTLEQVETASQENLGLWSRFLDTPGYSSGGEPNHEEIRDNEEKILNRILERFNGWTPELSKKVGWD